MSKRATDHTRRGQRGFTFVEAVVALLLATLFLGGVLQFHANALRTMRDMQDKEAKLQVLDAAMQILLADPSLLEKDTLTLHFLPESPEVRMELEDIEDLAEASPPPGAPVLRRLRVTYEGVFLESCILGSE